jgi:hypothetical protein
VNNGLAVFLLTACSLWAQAPALPAPGGSIPDPPGRGRGPAFPKGPTPRLADGKVDLSGVWRPDNGFVGNISRILKPGDTISMKPEAEKLMKSRKAGQDPEANCLPTGVPRQAPYPWTIAQAPGKLFFLFEGNIHSYRQIFMDGRQHPKDLDPTWYGDSIGHWEGDTLVIDTVGFNELFWFDFAGHPHTSQLHVVERYTRTDLGTLVEEVTIDDPGAYTKPWTGKFTINEKTISSWIAGGDMFEYICEDAGR